MVDADRLSLGAELMYSLGEYEMPIRFGFLWREFSYVPAGSSGPPVEYAFSVGFGLPFRNDNGSFDVALQAGSRGMSIRTGPASVSSDSPCPWSERSSLNTWCREGDEGAACTAGTLTGAGFSP
jgi:hypothetical protein